MNKKFADTLKKIRTSKSISQHELAEKIFVTRSAIAKWENGYSLPDMLMIKRICKALEVNEYDLMKILLDGDDELNVILNSLVYVVTTYAEGSFERYHIEGVEHLQFA